MIGLLLLAPDNGARVAEIARTFGVDWLHLGAQIISFSIVCGLLYKFAYKQILTMLEERRKQIAQGLENAARIKAELDRTAAMREEVMAQAHAQAAKAIEQARADAAQLRERERRTAMASADQIILNAREGAAREHDRMLAELKGELGRLVVQTTQILAGRVLTPDDHRRLTEEAARQIAA